MIETHTGPAFGPAPVSFRGRYSPRPMMFAAAVVVATSATVTQVSDPVQAELAALRAELAEFAQSQASDALTTERAAEIRSTVRDALAHASSRASLQGSGATAGYDNGFFMSSADGNFSLCVGALEQVRFVWEFDTQSDMGFENRRNQLHFGGHMFDPSWAYRVVFNYSPYTTPYGEDANTFTLADASITKQLGSGFGVVTGQYRTPFTRATLVGDGVQLMADYSPMDYDFSAGYQQGIMGTWGSDSVRAMVSVGNAIGATNSSWTSGTDISAVPPVFGDNAETFNGAARVEWLVAGGWVQFEKETSFRGESFGMLLGAAYLRSDSSGSGNYDVESAGDLVDGFTADATVMFGGANLSVVYAYRNGKEEDTPTSIEIGEDEYGFSIQGGAFLTDSVEFWGAWNYLDVFRGDRVQGSYIQSGFNWYLHGNGCKLTAQVCVPLEADGRAANQLYQRGAFGEMSNFDTSFLTQLQFMF